MTKKRQYRSNQGRSPQQMEKAYKMMGWSLIALIITFVYIILTN
jgi:hypothetical protein